MPALLFGNYVGTFTVPNTSVESQEVRDFPTFGEAGIVTTPPGSEASVEIQNGGDSIFFARDQVRLLPGFTAHSGSRFQALIYDGTSSNSPDYDGDGLNDFLEEIYGYDPTTSDFPGSADWDGDGTNNANELANGTELGSPFAPVGTLPGDVSVDNRGSLSYAIPLDLPKGTGGTQPSLSLLYHNGTGKGNYGVGWTLGGLSSITRSGTTPYLDNPSGTFNSGNIYVDGIDYDRTDRLMLDGQRLKVISGNYFDNGAQYGTEVDQFARITQYNSDINNDAYFQAETKDGLLMTYGGNESSRYQSSGTLQTITWALSKIEDKNGNEVTFSYLEDVSGHRIDTVEYGYLDGSYDAVEVKFIYEDNQNGIDDTKAYVNGGLALSPFRVSEIQVSEQNVRLRDYEFSYSTSSTGRSLLTGVQLRSYGSNGTTSQVLPQTAFNYRAGGSFEYTKLTTASADVGAWTGSNNTDSRFFPGDFNGDGIVDIGKYYRSASNQFVFEVFSRIPDASDGFGEFNKWINGVTFEKTVTTNLNTPNRLQVADFNGDGYTDFAYDNYTGSSGNASRNLQIYLSTGTGFKNAITYNRGTNLSIPSTSASQEIFGTADLNGDGRPEFISGDWSNSGGNTYDVMGLSAYYLVGSASASQPQSTSNLSISSISSGFQHIGVNHMPGSSDTLMADLTGDGMDDLCVVYENGSTSYLRVYPSSGFSGATFSNTDSFQITLSGFDYDENRNYFPADMNGDGLNDFVASDKLNSNLRYMLFLNKGDRTFVHESTISVPFDFLNFQTEQRGSPADLNGDGQLDLLISHRTSDSNADTTFRGYTFDGSNFVSLGTDTSSQDWDVDSITIPMSLNNEPTPDILVLYEGASSTLGHIYQSSYTVPDILESTTNGLGAHTAIQWKAGTTRAGVFYVKDDAAWDGSSQGAHVIPADYSQYPIQRLVYGGLLPHVITKDSGAEPGDHAYATTYSFSEMESDLWGRGYMGFGSFNTWDNQRRLVKVTSLMRSFPYTGLTKSTESYAVLADDSSEILESTSNTWSTKTRNGLQFPYISSSTTRSYHFSENVNSSGSPYDNPSIGTLASRVKTTNDFDSYGNNTLVYVNTYASDSDSDRKLEIRTSNTYTNDTTNWILGRLAQTTVRHNNDEYTDPNGLPTRKSSWTYHASTGQMLSETIEPNQPAHKLHTVYTYDTFGNILTETVSGGSGTTSIPSATTSYAYDETGRYGARTTNALNHTASSVYGRKGYGTPTLSVGPNGLATSVELGLFGEPIRATAPDGSFTRTMNVPRGQMNGEWAEFPSAKYAILTQSVYADVRTASDAYVYYDYLGREVGTSSLAYRKSGTPSVILTKNYFDDYGRLERTVDPYRKGQTTYSSYLDYDRLDRVVRTRKETENPTNSGKLTITNLNFYNLLKMRVRMDAGGLNQDNVTFYNVQGNTAYTKDEQGNTLNYTYDEHLNLASTVVKDASGVTVAGSTVTINYDIRGNKISMDDPDMGQWSYTHDVLGRLVQQTDQIGNTTSISYDTIGRMTSKSVGSLSYSWNYDSGTGASIGKVVREESSDAIRSYDYDSLGRLSSETLNAEGKSFTISHTYEANSRLLATTYPSGYWVRNTYDQETGALYQIDDQAGEIWYAAPDTDIHGKLSEYMQGAASGGMVTFIDNRGGTDLVQRISAYRGSTDYFDYSFTHDNVGNILSRNDSLNSEHWGYKYDNLNRLTHKRINNSGAWTSIATYQVNGNLNWRRNIGNYTYDTNRIHAVTAAGNNRSYAYDNNGRLTSKTVSGSTTTVTWESFNKPTRIQNGSDKIEFSYDAANSRVYEEFTENGVVRKKWIFGSYEYEEKNGASWERHYVAGPTGGLGTYTLKDPASGSNQSEVRFFLVDHLGSLMVGVDHSFSASNDDKFAYNAWGERVSLTNWDSKLTSWADNEWTGDRGFTGHEMLNMFKLVHMNGRIYDPEIGRFLSADPFVQFEGDIQSYNRYSYVLNNPLRYTDPSGYLIPVIAAAAAWIVTGEIAVALTTLLVSSIVWAGVQGYQAGGFRGAVRGAMMAGLAAAVTYGIGQIFQTVPIENLYLKELLRASAHGLSSGIFTEMGGGEFGSGFLAGFASSLAGTAQMKIGGSSSSAGFIFASIVGGTMSELSGGSFANGAISGAFNYLLNHAQTMEKTQREQVDFEVAIRDPHPNAGVKAFGSVVYDPETGEIISKSAYIGTTKVGVGSVEGEFKGLGELEIMAQYDAKSGTLTAGLRGSVSAAPIAFAEGFVTGPMGHPKASLTIDFALQVQINPSTRTGFFGVAHDAYPSYNISVGGKSVYDRLQHKVPLIKLDPPVDVFKKGSFSY